MVIRGSLSDALRGPTLTHTLSVSSQSAQYDGEYIVYNVSLHVDVRSTFTVKEEV